VILGGYFPKRVALRPAWLGDPRVAEVCSISHCISEGPDGWINQWRHNALGWFNRQEEAWSVVPAADVARHRLFAYRLAPSFYRQGRPEQMAMPEDEQPEPGDYYVAEVLERRGDPETHA